MDNLALDLQNENIPNYRVSMDGDDRQPGIDKLDINPSITERTKRKRLYYQINDTPPWYITIFLGFQHYLTMAGSTVSVPFILCPKMCMVDDDPDKANIISTLIFTSGIVTLLQSTLGTRLPIIQGGSFSFIVPALAILQLPEWQCPSAEELSTKDASYKTELWQTRMRELQGAIIIASLFEVVFGALGIVGLVLKYITPLTIAPAIAMIGISLFTVAGQHASSNWGISGLTIFLVLVFSQYLRLWKIPIPFTKSDKRSGCKRYPLFEVFPVLLAMAIVWSLCVILTVTDALPEGDPARTDIKTKIITQSEWFRVPYPLQWGIPTVTAGAVFGMLSGVITGSIESIGDYYACARIAGAPKPPTHAINRGIFIEGLGCVLAGLWGTGNGTTSYSENIGAMSVTNVGSRRVIQAAGILMIICSLIGKVGSVFISIPEPIIGGIFCVVFAIVTAVGLSNLQGVDLNSSRNIFILGFSLFFSMTVSQWMAAHPGVIKIGNDHVDQILTILLSTGMFVAGFIGFFLDNTIPGTKKERGITDESQDDGFECAEGEVELTYDIPLVTGLIRRVKFLTYVPISPTYKKKLRDDKELTTINSLNHATTSNYAFFSLVTFSDSGISNGSGILQLN
ncbi:unnamed protein product [Allacma fusca]|uniref:Uncharacterized protein n=1 Tax=Allacma fusca TaxID=39272 RepID=A0A8J2LIR7_9HEXA|nr:unnamed protein product [Allacma fusca]